MFTATAEDFIAPLSKRRRHCLGNTQKNLTKDIDFGTDLFMDLGTRMKCLKKYIRTILENEAIIYKGTGEEREYIHIRRSPMTVDAIDSKYDGQCLLLTGQEFKFERCAPVNF